MIKAAFAVAKERIDIVATTWSPAKWMKTNNDYSGVSMLKQEYYQTYADYHLKYVFPSISFFFFISLCCSHCWSSQTSFGGRTKR